LWSPAWTTSPQRPTRPCSASRSTPCTTSSTWPSGWPGWPSGGGWTPPGPTAGWLAAGYGLAFLYGLFAAGNSDINFLSLNGADNGLHLVSAVAGLAIALWPVQRTARRGLADRGA
jgi:hypothetical protein